MKCIRIPDGNGGMKAVRCTEKYANLAVSSGSAVYVSKTEWKAEGRQYVR